MVDPEVKSPSVGSYTKQGNSRGEKKKKDYFCFIDCAKVFDCVDHNKQIFQTWKILKEMGIPDHLTCLLRNLYAAQEAIVSIRYGLVQNQDIVLI